MRKDVDIFCRSDVHPSRVPDFIRANNEFTYLPSSRRVILIHGFLNDECDASDNFHKFRLEARDISSEFQNEMFGMTWPGDDIPWCIHNLFKSNVANAQGSGQLLAEFLEEIMTHHPKQLEIIIIAHSLGCYLTLVSLVELSRLGVKFGHRLRVYFMAPAFPARFLEDGTDYSNALAEVKSKLVFYSPKDKTLRFLFPLGHLFSEKNATGLDGDPKQGVLEGKYVNALGFDHGDYWPDVFGEVCNHIAYDIGYHGVPRPNPFSGKSIEERQLVARAPLKENRLNTR